jgi:hypothetical protein
VPGVDAEGGLAPSGPGATLVLLLVRVALAVRQLVDLPAAEETLSEPAHAAPRGQGSGWSPARWWGRSLDDRLIHALGHLLALHRVRDRVQLIPAWRAGWGGVGWAGCTSRSRLGSAPPRARGAGARGTGTGHRLHEPTGGRPTPAAATHREYCLRAMSTSGVGSKMAKALCSADSIAASQGRNSGRGQQLKAVVW